MTRVHGRRDFVRTVSNFDPPPGFLEHLYAELGARVHPAGKSTVRKEKPISRSATFF